jgi:hypothetical protein
MTRFTLQGDVTWGDGSAPRSVNVMVENMEGWNAYVGKVNEMVTFAVKFLTDTIAHLNNGAGSGTAGFAKQVFLTGDVLEESDLATIKAVLIKTLNGMTAAGLAIKVHNTATFAGQVTMKRLNGAPMPSSKPYHSVNVYSGDDLAYRAGAIHILGDRLVDAQGLGVKTLIHEATHKYAGTADYCYFSMSRTGVTPDREFTSKARALANADSYGFFAYFIGGVIAAGQGDLLTKG